VQKHCPGKKLKFPIGEDLRRGAYFFLRVTAFVLLAFVDFEGEVQKCFVFFE
jgi:hypothetical protein